MVSASASTATAATGALVASAQTGAVVAAAAAAAAKSLAPIAGGTPSRHHAQHRRVDSKSALRSVGSSAPGTKTADAAALAESSGARGTGWAGLFDGPPTPPPRRPGAASVQKRETPRLRWLARALRDSVAERVWASPAAAGANAGSAASGDGNATGGGGGGSSLSSGAVEAMKLLLQDLAHSYQGRRASARRALQSVLASSPAARRGSAKAGMVVGGPGSGAGRTAWTPASKGPRDGVGQSGGEGDKPEGERVVVTLEEADAEQCGWLFCCRNLPAWTDVSCSSSGRTIGGKGYIVGVEFGRMETEENDVSASWLVL